MSSDSNISLFFESEKKLSQSARSQKKGRGAYTFSRFFKGPTIHLSAIFGSQQYQHFEDIAKNGQKDFEDFAEALSVRQLKRGKKSSGRSTRETLLLFMIADISGKSATALRILLGVKGGNLPLY